MDDIADAGDFTQWLNAMQTALEDHGAVDVPCNGCTACCTSFQFVDIEPDENDTIAHIPAELLFPAPLRPKGHMVLGYDERGHCPMLIDNRCSIYDHRPRACRTYDCRIFPATGVEVEDEKPAIAERTRRWRFSYTDEASGRAHVDLKTIAQQIAVEDEHHEPRNATERAVLTIRRYSQA